MKCTNDSELDIPISPDNKSENNSQSTEKIIQ